MRVSVRIVALCLTLAPTVGTAQSANRSSAASKLAATEETATAKSEPVETVIVTGTRLRASTEQTAQELNIYDRPRIEHSGQTTVADFLATVPEVSLNSMESTYGATSVRLRGAPEGSALILINGHRAQSTTGFAALLGFFDLNTIPLSMVERIDVLPNGSSAIYGGEALAGVVNIVLRSDFKGTVFDVGYKHAADIDETQYSAGYGWAGESARFSVMASYSDRGSLNGSDREITASPDYRPLGGPNLGSVFFGTPATIFATAGNLPGLNSRFAAVPIGSSGVGLQPAEFAATAGTQHTGSTTQYQDLYLNSTRKGVFATGDYRLRGGTDLFAELLASDYDNDGVTTPAFLLQASVPTSNAFNPFGTTVLAAGVVKGAEPLATFEFHDKFLRPLVGARGTFGRWDWETTGVWSRDDGGFDAGGRANGAALSAALASSDPATALNPFKDGPMANPAVLAGIFNGHFVADWKADSTILNGFVRGAPAQLRAGPLDMVFGAEHERSGLERGMDANRYATAVFTEVRAPIVAAQAESIKGREVLALQGAVRYDDYSDFGAKTTWQAGVEYRPSESVLLRGTHGTAFKPPTLYDLAAPISTGPSPVVDPLRNGETVVVQFSQGGNPNLDPTTSESSTVGVTWSPREARERSLSLTWWTLRIDGAVSLPISQYIVNNESHYPGRVLRAPASPGQTGQIVSVDGTYVNYGSIREEGFDAGVEWGISTKVGTWTPALAVTYMTQFEGASAPGTADVDRLSRANLDSVFAPRVKGTVGAGWTANQRFTVSLAGRYIGQYTDYTPPRTIGDVWYIDASLRVSFGKTVSLLVTATNLTDKLPPYSTYFRGYDVYNYDLIGRTIFGRVQVRF